MKAAAVDARMLLKDPAIVILDEATVPRLRDEALVQELSRPWRVAPPW